MTVDTNSFIYLPRPVVRKQRQTDTLRPPAGRQYGMSISQQPLNRSLPNFQQLLLMKAKLKVSVHLYMGNYVNQVHHISILRNVAK